jgi:hypothetical protein
MSKIHLFREWLRVADGARDVRALIEYAPLGVICRICWDFGVCAECLGDYPLLCPAECGDGRCFCAAGKVVSSE